MITLGLKAIFDNPIRSWDIWIKVLFQTNFAKSVFSQFFSNFLNISAPRLWIKNRLDESSRILTRCLPTKFEPPGSSRSGCRGGWVWKTGCTFTAHLLNGGLLYTDYAYLLNEEQLKYVAPPSTDYYEHAIRLNFIPIGWLYLALPRRFFNFNF